MPVISPILAPVVALVAWTMVMWLWMFAVRIPAMTRAGIKLDATIPRGEQMNQLPARVRWKADNYNHLMEQPTIFYPVAIVLALIGAGDGTNLMLAWAYVGLRVVHSIFQSLVNKIEVRFVLFLLSSLVLIAMIFNAARLVF